MARNTLSLAVVLAGVLAAGCGRTDAQSGGAPVPFKLGTFERNGQAFVGLVLRDTQVVDIAQANAAFESSNGSAPKLAAPADMTQLIAGYDGGWRELLGAIARQVSAASSAPAYAYQASSLRTLPPVRPALQLMAAGNYTEHLQGIAEQQRRAGGGGQAEAPAPPGVESIPGVWERKPDDRRPNNPYLYQKAPTVLIGHGESVVVPRGRTMIDYECEIAIVVGRPAKYVPVERAGDYIFGYTGLNDVSDRGSRGDRHMGGSADWLLGKNHDTFGPLGPYIVPKEFFKDPTNTRHVLTLNGTVMQDSNTNRMTHNVYELVSFSSGILTLNPGDVIAGGSPAGTNIERADPRWMRPGDRTTCMVEGVGELTNPVAAEPAASTN